MKANNFNKVEDLLNEVKELLEEIYNCDTSFQHPNWESEHEIEFWNKRLNQTMNEIEMLRMEMIFTFKIDEEPGE